MLATSQGPRRSKGRHSRDSGGSLRRVLPSFHTCSTITSLISQGGRGGGGEGGDKGEGGDTFTEFEFIRNVYIVCRLQYYNLYCERKSAIFAESILKFRTCVVTDSRLASPWCARHPTFSPSKSLRVALHVLRLLSVVFLFFLLFFFNSSLSSLPSKQKG